MKDIGFTKDGNVIVEMSRDEIREFSNLCAAVEGRSHLEIVTMNEYRFSQFFDFTKTFEVIRAYYVSRFQINQLQYLLDDMKKSLEKVGVE